jgi:hypothetical protein
LEDKSSQNRLQNKDGICKFKNGFGVTSRLHFANMSSRRHQKNVFTCMGRVLREPLAGAQENKWTICI